MKTKGLSLAEAHASGRKYKPVGEHHSAYFRYDIDRHLSWFAATTLYELEPEAKLLTREEVGAAMFLQLNISTMDRQRVLDKLFGSEEGDV